MSIYSFHFVFLDHENLKDVPLLYYKLHRHFALLQRVCIVKDFPLGLIPFKHSVLVEFLSHFF